MMSSTGQQIQALSAPLADAPELCRMDVATLVGRFANRSVSPVDAANAALARAETIQPRFNAFTLIDHAGALAAAHQSQERWRVGQPLSAIDGVPISIKDIVHVKDCEIFYGSAAAPPVRAEVDAPAVARLRMAGAVIIGLTTTPEFGWKAITDSRKFGVTRNPYDASKTPGGSSGGAAVAAACGAGVLHLGTDGGGSIRIPASFTGICGLKPTFGRVPAYPQSAFGTVAHLGPIAKTAADCAAMLKVMAGRHPLDWLQPPFGDIFLQQEDFVLARAFIGVWDSPPSGSMDGEVAGIFSKAVDRLAGEGVILRSALLPAEDHFDLFIRHWYAGAANRLRDVDPARHKLVDPGLLEIAAEGARYSAADLAQAGSRRAVFGARMDALLTTHDLLISPAVAIAPFEAGEEVPKGSGLRRWIEWAGFSYPINLSQQPATVIPCGMTADGLPVGLQIIGARGQDGKVLAAASAMAAVLPIA